VHDLLDSFLHAVSSPVVFVAMIAQQVQPSVCTVA
jgi:hypothetical protein